MLAEDAAGMDWLRRKSAMERRWGIESHVLGANELLSIAPALSERMVGADFVPAEGYGDPLRGTLAVRTLALRHGARVLTGAEVRSIAREGSRWVIETSRRPYRCRHGRQRRRSLGRADRADGGAEFAGHRNGAAGDRDGAGARADAPSDRRRQSAFVVEATGQRRISGGRRLVRRLRSRVRPDPQSAAQYRGQSLGLRPRAARVARACR